MKKNFMPSIDGLYKMQDAGLDIYSYLVAKAIEALTLNGTVLKQKGILNKKSLFKYITKDPELVLPICRMHPELISNLEIAYNDLELCNILIDGSIKSSTGLDNLMYFENGICIFTNDNIIKKVILLLVKELRQNPRYRFDYKENSLLNRIFSTEILNDIYTNFKDEEIKALLEIEPYYGMLLNGIELKDKKIAMSRYLDRYHIDLSYGEEYRNKDILTNRDNKVKRLIRTIENNNL